ncbi:hypothetical protein [Pseudolactococcus insecticola]|uniref:DUF4303 domain-containing protein n=1 Tax=Pseudolactococcus insecticola TaxID=2709158 RepID=A0A6A0BAB8_9LACT|nr:hypothetical protein [Lactococcus insecticola]GFH41398.1 hypothetical protein Hs20B_17960 [Lactococcus insecticola]
MPNPKYYLADPEKFLDNMHYQDLEEFFQETAKTMNKIFKNITYAYKNLICVDADQNSSLGYSYSINFKFFKKWEEKLNEHEKSLYGENHKYILYYHFPSDTSENSDIARTIFETKKDAFDWIFYDIDEGYFDLNEFEEKAKDVFTKTTKNRNIEALLEKMSDYTDRITISYSNDWYYEIIELPKGKKAD